MAFGSGSSFATDRWMRRGGLPSSAQAFSVGSAKRLHQHSSQKPTAHSGSAPATSISRSLAKLAFFSFVQGVCRGDPPLRPHPPHTKEAQQGGPDGLPGDTLRGESLLEGDIGDHLQSPKARLAPELPRRAVEHLPECLGALLVEGGVYPIWARRARGEGVQAPLVEGADGVPDRLRGAPEASGYLRGRLTAGAGQKDLAAAHHEGIFGAQSCFQTFALPFRRFPDKDWRFHADNYSPLHTTLSEDALTSLCNTAGLITPSRSTGGVQPMETHPAVRPFRVDVPEEDLDDLRRHIAATRWPSKELVEDRSQGVQLATLRELARYWTTEYDWRTCEARLNALPQFTTEIDGVDIHFIHVRSRHDNALPLIMTHGWPGSVIELLETVGPLTDPTSHGGRAEDAFDLVLPSLPGYGFSGEPTELGWGVGRVGQAWAELMRRLGYTRYVAQGGDVGAGVTDAMGRQAPEGLVGIHTNLLVTALGGPQPADTEEERAAAAAIATFRTTGIGYFTEMATRPQTIGYALLDSPVALAAWLLDHDTDAYYKIARAFVDGQPSGNLTRDHVLDNITLYWLTGTGASAARSYWEAYGPDAPAAGAPAPPPVSLPVGFTTFPGEIWRTPRSWVENSYPNLTYFNEVDKGGHFAAWEEPELFATEVRE